MKLWQATILSAVVASIVTDIVLMVGRMFVSAPPDYGPLQLAHATPFVIIGAVGAGIVYKALRSWTKNPDRNFLWTSAIVLVLSFIPDIFVNDLGPMFQGATIGTIILLIVLHIVAAACIVPIMLRSKGATVKVAS